jgi:hypothetical protein
MPSRWNETGEHPHTHQYLSNIKRRIRNLVDDPIGSHTETTEVRADTLRFLIDYCNDCDKQLDSWDAYRRGEDIFPATSSDEA